jgi:ketosteroid isomerase-like protein
MSSENVGLVKTILSAAQTDWELASSKLDPDVRLDQSRFPDGGIYHGRAAFRDFYRRWFGTWDDLRITPERFFEAGDRVIAFITLEGRGKGSGTPVTLRAANVWTIRDGKVVELVGYLDRAEALEAVGLSDRAH